MAGYDEDRQGAYDAIRDAGGPVTIRYTPTDAAPVDEARPWEGSEAEPVDFPHVAAFVPLSTLLGRGANPFGEAALIPALGLPFEIVVGMSIEKADESGVTVAQVIIVKPDGLTPILYQCEVNPWPAT
jgi:hypothetical protein